MVYKLPGKQSLQNGLTEERESLRAFVNSSCSRRALTSKSAWSLSLSWSSAVTFFRLQYDALKPSMRHMTSQARPTPLPQHELDSREQHKGN